MHATRQATAQALWLMLLVGVLVVSMNSPVRWVESQQQELTLESGYLPDFPEEETPVGAVALMLLAGDFLTLSPGSNARLSPFGSDAYPCIAVHGPPSPFYSV